MLLQHPHQHTQNKTKQQHTACACLCACARAHTHLTPHFRGCKHPSPPHRPHPPTRKHSHTGRGRRRLRGGGRPRMLLWACVLSVYALHCCAWPVWPPMRGSGRPHHMMSNGPNAPFVACQAAYDACDACPSCMFESLIIIARPNNAWACITGGRSVELGQDDGDPPNWSGESCERSRAHSRHWPQPCATTPATRLPITRAPPALLRAVARSCAQLRAHCARG